LASEKDRVEHQLVVDEIVAILQACCASVETSTPPELVRLRTIAHLGTEIRGSLASADTPPSALELMALLHPTPAVGGVPREIALSQISELETFPRGPWAGPIGWVDATGDGVWMIGIRSALVNDERVRVTAGAGIVADSDPEAEFTETGVKLLPVLEAFDLNLASFAE
jgi:isochorismate synthase EntC